jgi:hypothetical protein
MSNQYSRTLELAVSDPAELGSLEEWLSWNQDLTVTRATGEPGPGELGAHDVLTILASSSALIAMIKTLPAFIRSRRSNIHIEMTVKGDRRVIDASNIDNIQPVIDGFMNDDPEDS